MTRVKQRLSALRNLQSLRILHSNIAEAKLVFAQNKLRETKEQVQKQRTLLDEAVDNWNQAVSSSVFHPMSVVIWSQHVNLQVANVAEAEEKENEAHQDVLAESKALSHAQASEECAETLVKSALRKLSVANEIRLAADLADDLLWRVAS
jgi:hypothetical protein